MLTSFNPLATRAGLSSFKELCGTATQSRSEPESPPRIADAADLSLHAIQQRLCMFLERHVQDGVQAFTLHLMNGVDPQRRRIAVSQVLYACERHVRQRRLGQLASNVVGRLQTEFRLYPESRSLIRARSEVCHCPLATNDEEGSPLIESRVNAQISLRSSRCCG